MYCLLIQIRTYCIIAVNRISSVFDEWLRNQYTIYKDYYVRNKLMFKTISHEFYRRNEGLTWEAKCLTMLFSRSGNMESE